MIQIHRKSSEYRHYEPCHRHYEDGFLRPDPQLPVSIRDGEDEYCCKDHQDNSQDKSVECRCLIVMKSEKERYEHEN